MARAWTCQRVRLLKARRLRDVARMIAQFNSGSRTLRRLLLKPATAESPGRQMPREQRLRLLPSNSAASWARGAQFLFPFRQRGSKSPCATAAVRRLNGEGQVSHTLRLIAF